ncbi:hypothetical protein F5X96DRAFT_677538 [Biscogniauxia mediterranea]|nr:hypothetical protein F5X96DRAFT_677538 [Biscogniauxia mediterranea]
MEPPSKRLKVQQALYESDDEANQDELSMTPSQFDARQDPLYQLDKGRAKAATRLKSTFESIFEKYEKDFTGIGDEIDLRTGEIIIDNGHLQSLEDEKDGGREGSVSSDEEERILRGKESRPAKRPHPTSLMSANPSLYNPIQPLDPWKQPAMVGANPYGISSLSFPPAPLGDPNQLPFALSMFSNNPTDPAWQAPELPSPFPQNGFGFGFGYNPQAPGFPQSLSFDMASKMATGGGHYGFYGGMARQQGFRRLVRAKSLTRRSLPATESKESDTDEDDILLAKDQKAASKPTVAKEAQKTPTPAAFEHQNKIDNQGITKESATSQDSPKSDERQTEIRDETGSGEIRRGNGLTGTPTKHNRSPSLRPVGRPKKTNATTKQKSDSEHTELNNNIQIARATEGVYEKTPRSQQESEVPRRKPGRPKKSTVPEESQSLLQNTIKNRRPNIDTKTSLHPETATSKPTTGSSIMISLPVRPNHTSTAPTQVNRDKTETTKQNAFDSQRRSSRARKQTEFYGNMKWLKRGVRPSNISDEDVNQGSESSQTSTSFSQEATDDQDSSSTKYAGSESSVESAQLTTNDEVLPESEDAWTEKEQDIQSRIELETKNGGEVENAVIRSSPQEDGHIENEITDQVLAEDSHVSEPSVLEKSGTNNAEASPQTTEAFSRNELDPSYDFSDCEEEPVRKTVDLADGVRAVPREQHTSSDGPCGFGNTDTSLDRQTGPDDVTKNQMPAISDLSEAAKSELGPDTGSFDTTRESVVSDISDREVTRHHSELPSKTQFTPEPDLPRQEPECQQGFGEPDGQPNAPDGTVTDQARSPTLSPELHIQDSLRESEIASRFSPELGENNAEPEVSAEKSAEDDPDAELAGSSKSPEARRLAAVSDGRASVPVTPKKPRRPKTGQNGPTSSAKRFALASLVPDADNGGDDDSDEPSIISSSNYYTPRSFRAKLARARRYSASSYSYVSTPRSASRRHNLLVGTADRSRAPATDSRALLRASRNVLGGGKGRSAAGGGDSNVLSSPLARTAAKNLLRTPRHNRKRPTSPTASLVQTPGGTIRRCGEDGFVCERDFCFTCCK